MPSIPICASPQDLAACFSRALLQGLSRLPDRTDIMALRQTARTMAGDRKNRSVEPTLLLNPRFETSPPVPEHAARKHSG